MNEPIIAHQAKRPGLFIYLFLAAEVVFFFFFVVNFVIH